MGSFAGRRFGPVSLFEGKTVWNVSSTAAGGGVAEMLQVLVGYTLDADIDIRWLVMNADPEFFSITKRIHNRLHGTAGDTGELGPNEAAHYAEITAANAIGVMSRVRQGDVVLLHDPQTAGMAPALAEAGARVVWRCHIGRAGSNHWTEEAWSFLRPHLAHCEAYIFSLPEYVPSWIEASRVRVIPPSIDPFSPKNQDMSPSNVILTLGRIGLLQGAPKDPPGAFIRGDGAAGHVERQATIVSANGAPLGSDVPLVVQVSRWDRLKDMEGVMEGFASRACRRWVMLTWRWWVLRWSGLPTTQKEPRCTPSAWQPGRIYQPTPADASHWSPCRWRMSTRTQRW